jgi:tetratricopeptide (TPR) repeat protein
MDVEAKIAQILRRFPREEQLDAICDAGDEIAALGEDDAALAFFDHAIRMDASFSRAWASRAKMLVKRGRRQEAVKCMERAVEAAPNDPSLLTQQADLLARTEERERALACYARALRLQPNSAAVWIKRAELLVALARYDEAISAYDRALALDDAPDTWRAHGDALTKLERFPDAAESYERALALDSGDIEALYALARTETKLGEFEQAAATLKRYLALVPVTDPRGKKARAWLLEKERREAEAKLSRASRTSTRPLPDPQLASLPPMGGFSEAPPPPEADLVETKRLLQGRHLTGALRRADRVVEADPGNAEAWRVRAQALIALGRHREAAEAARRMQILEPESAVSCLLLGRALIALGNLAEGLSALDRAIALSHGAKVAK